MTETEWLLGSNLDACLSFFQRRASERKRRLFGCACCRRVWDLLQDERSRLAVELSERYADGLATPEELQAAWLAADEVGTPRDRPELRRWAVESAIEVARRPLDTLRVASDAIRAHRGAILQDAERRVQVSLLRDLLGNPFRPLHLDATWLRWNAQCVPRIARSIYDGRTFGDLPVLADALAEAGCTDAAILDHCRTLDHHARGCWVLDALLGLD